MYKIAVMGDRDSVLGFRALGLDVFFCDEAEAGRKTLHRLAQQDYAVIYITEQLAQELKNGLELRPSKKVGAGFRLAAKDGSGYFDCSDQEIAEMLMPFFRDMHL